MGHHSAIINTQYASLSTHTHTHLTALCPGLPRWAGTRKVKPIWILLKQETVSGSAQFFTGRMPFLPPNQQRQSTEGSVHQVKTKYDISICLTKFYVSNSLLIWLALLFINYYIKKYFQQQSDKLTAGFLPFFSNVLRRRQPSHSYFAVYMSGERTRSTELSRLQHTRLTHQRPNYLSLLDSYIFSYQELGTAHNKGIKSRVDGWWIPTL